MFTLDEVMPWGRSFDEYCRMFALDQRDLKGRILGCADGPASFNAEATRRGSSVVSCDPIYRLSTFDLRARIAATYDKILEQTRTNQDEFVWTAIKSPDELGRLRLAAMDVFLEDYDAGRRTGRYLDAKLPELPFVDHSFDLAVCSHFLFLYSEQLGEEFHKSAIFELCRVAKEVRVFPLLALGAKPSPHVSTIRETLQNASYKVSIETVPYEFQRGGNQLLRIRH
jgi:hypothetical protein